MSSSSAVCPDTPEGHFRASSASWSLWEVKAWKKGGCECPEVCAFQGREVGSEKRLGSASSFRAVGGAGSAWHCGRSCYRFRLCFLNLGPQFDAVQSLRFFKISSRCRDPAQTTPRKSGSSATQITWIISCLDKLCARCNYPKGRGARHAGLP